jgi:hypothetical protein
MSPQPTTTSSQDLTETRRRFLAAAGTVAGIATAGCGELGLSSGPAGEGDTIEILVSNGTSEPARIAVRVEDSDGSSLFSRVYDLGAEKRDESAGIETRPSTVRVFTPDGTSATWEYAPDTDLRCEGKDIGIRLTRDEMFESYYSC